MIDPHPLRLKHALPGPLIAIIRQLAAELPAEGAEADGHRTRREVALLLAHFSPRFEQTGVIAIDAGDAPAVLRACARLRLELRRGALKAIPDEVLENSRELEMEQPEGRCFRYLAELQEYILYLVPQLADVPIIDAAMARRWLARARGFFRAAGARGKAAEETWQVVVVNDPVNLMSYVKLVFRLVLRRSKEEADRAMREVHEQKSCVVWQGARGEAEAHARALQAWHLSVELRTGK